jgi:hypothetical protein
VVLALQQQQWQQLQILCWKGPTQQQLEHHCRLLAARHPAPAAGAAGVLLCWPDLQVRLSWERLSACLGQLQEWASPGASCLLLLGLLLRCLQELAWVTVQGLCWP